MSNARQKLGRWGATMAAQHLEKAGYAVVDRNYRCPAGEIDLVVRIGDCWVFVEVKTRRGDRYGLPEEAITPTKATRLLECAQSYLQENQLERVDWRVDVVAVELDRTGRLLRVDYIENAVSAW